MHVKCEFCHYTTTGTVGTFVITRIDQFICVDSLFAVNTINVKSKAYIFYFMGRGQVTSQYSSPSFKNKILRQLCAQVVMTSTKITHLKTMWMNEDDNTILRTTEIHEAVLFNGTKKRHSSLLWLGLTFIRISVNGDIRVSTGMPVSKGHENWYMYPCGKSIPWSLLSDLMIRHSIRYGTWQCPNAIGNCHKYAFIVFNSKEAKHLNNYT